MQKQKFDEIVSYFNKKVSEMEIETKYKMELLGVVTALGYAHEKETHDKRTETHACDCISRQAAIDSIDAGHLVNPNEPRWSDNEVVNFLKSRPSAQPEKICVANVTLTDEQVKEAFEKTKCEILAVQSAQPERWIPVSERLPEEDLWTGRGKQFSNSVLMTVYDKNDEDTIVDYGHTMDGEWYSETGDEYIESIADWKVIAWMPLPEPYKGEQE